jgi:hypothetical protein
MASPKYASGIGIVKQRNNMVQKRQNCLTSMSTRNNNVHEPLKEVLSGKQ